MILSETLYNFKKKLVRWYENYFTVKGLYTCILPDKMYIKKLYKFRTGKELDLKNPRTFNEKMNWLKLYDRKPEYTVMADKYLARKFIADRIGDEYLVPLLGVWDSPDEIDFDSLPDKFVLKCNHDNGVIICTDKSRLDIEKTKKELASRLKRDYYKKLREWPYKNIPRKIICEKFMENTNGNQSVEYKTFCFNGELKYTLVISDRFTNQKVTMDTYTREWKHTDLINGGALAGDVYAKPECYDELCKISEFLSTDIPFLRVDFNYWNEKLYFGELTLYDSGGFEFYQPEEWSYKLGELLELPQKRRR